MNDLWTQAIIAPQATIYEAIQVLDRCALQIVLVVDEYDRLLGVVTDGDVRRAVLNRVDMSSAVADIMNAKPMTALPNEDNATVLARLSPSRLRHMPIVDAHGKLVGLKTLNDLLEDEQQKSAVALMVGGLGTRLGELTHATPKPMLEVGGKPVLQTIIERFVAQGFKTFYLAVNYKADIIRSFFGDGSSFGANIQYVLEDEKLGTAGALSLLPEVQEHPLLVMNGDVLTKVDFKSLLDFHLNQHAVATMCVREYEFQVPFGVVNINDHMITQVDEKPTHQFFVNAGIYVLSPQALSQIPRDQYYDMTTLFSELVAQKKRATCFPIREYWLDIGRLPDLQKAGREFEDHFTKGEVE